MEKIKHVLLIGVVIISLVVFSVMYYARVNNVSRERVASRALADSDEDEEDDVEEDEDDDDEKESEDEENDDEGEDEDDDEIRKESGSSARKIENNNLSTSERRDRIKMKEDDEDDEDEIGDDEMDDDDRKEIDSEDGGDKTTVLRDVIVNEDGTTTHRLTIIKKDGRKKVTEQMFDANNKLILKKKSEIRSENGEEKTEIKTFDVFGKKIGEYKMETKDGKKIEIRRKNIEGESRLKFNMEKNELMVKIEDDEEDDAKAFLRVKADKNSTKIKLMHAGIIANSNFPIMVDDETGRVYVKTPNKDVELKQMPDVIVEKAKQSGEIDIVEDNTLEGDDRPSYVLKGTKFQKFLGFYTVEIPSEITYDADTGEKISVNVPGFKKMLSWFSF